VVNTGKVVETVIQLPAASAYQALTRTHHDRRHFFVSARQKDVDGTASVGGIVMEQNRTISVGLTVPAGVRIVERTRKLAHHLFRSYRPELHYMRGPGPKWREKHGLPPVRAHVGELGFSNPWKAGV
jgi:hypothetical protein